MTNRTETFQVSTAAAEVYEEKFVPALFGAWAGHLVEAGGVGEGHAVLDVACGTGVVARAAADLVGSAGRVAGVDINEGMLAVARRLRPDIEWHRGDVADLPFGDGTFDVTLCQAALMFFPDPAAALREIARVTRRDGTVAAQVWGSLAEQPAYRRLADIVVDHAGADGVDLLNAYFSLGDLNVVEAQCRSAGLEVVRTTTRTGEVRFGSIDEFVRTEIEGTPLVDRIDAETYEEILQACRDEFAVYETDGGTRIPIQGHLVVAGRA